MSEKLEILLEFAEKRQTVENLEFDIKIKAQSLMEQGMAEEAFQLEEIFGVKVPYSSNLIKQALSISFENGAIKQYAILLNLYPDLKPSISDYQLNQTYNSVAKKGHTKNNS